MYRKVAAVWVSLLIMVSSIVILVEIAERVEAPTTLYVGGGGPGNYSKIQDAINAAIPGDTVFVYNGTYYENVVVDKTINLTGEDRNTTVIDGGGNGDVVSITVSDINITEFNIINSMALPGYAGIKIIKPSINNKITYNNIFSHYWACIYLATSSNNTIINNKLYASDFGIYTWNSSNNIIEGNNITQNNWGISFIFKSDNNIIKNNNISNNDEGISATSKGCKIINNTIFGNNRYGINLQSAENNSIINNSIYDCIQYGIYLLDSNNNSFLHNTLVTNGRGFYFSNSIYNNIKNHTVTNNDYGIYLQSSENNNILNNDISSCWNGIEFNSSSNSSIIGNNISGGERGIFLRSNSDNNIINGNNITKNSYGIFMDMVSKNVIIGNNLSSNGPSGIYVGVSSNNNITNNIALNNQNGIHLYNSNKNNLSNNNVSSNHIRGIELSSSNMNNLMGNTISSNLFFGIYIDSSTQNNISSNIAINNGFIGIYILDSNITYMYNNIMQDSGIILEGDLIEHWNTHIINTSNQVNGMPVIYWKNQTGGKIPLGAGEVILANCTNVIVENQEVANNTVFIQLGFSSNNSLINNIAIRNLYGIYIKYSNKNNLTNNTVSNNDYGLFLTHSSYNTVVGNNIFSNDQYGISITQSSNNNTLHHNNLYDNLKQVLLHNSTCFNNTWDDGNGEGNYWSDYYGLDDGSGGRNAGDGVGDTEIPHPFIDQGNGYYQLDNFPMINPIGNYLFLYQGWNLISIPFIQLETELYTVLSSITNHYNAVQWYDAMDINNRWNHNKINKPYGNDLSELNETMSFWIHITRPGVTILMYNGTPPTSNQTIQLHPGWNMVGYPSLTSYNRTTGLNNLTFDTHVDCIQWYDAGTKTWHFMGPDDNFVPGRGYWVHSKVDAEWEVPL